ncbi:MAG: hypothetical protein ACI9CO_000983 [Candidatus Azotimanducaceae bacterium]|jgi:hypothetical protein
MFKLGLSVLLYYGSETVVDMVRQTDRSASSSLKYRLNQCQAHPWAARPSCFGYVDQGSSTTPYSARLNLR